MGTGNNLLSKMPPHALGKGFDVEIYHTSAHPGKIARYY